MWNRMRWIALTATGILASVPLVACGSASDGTGSIASANRGNGGSEMETKGQPESNPATGERAAAGEQGAPKAEQGSGGGAGGERRGEQGTPEGGAKFACAVFEELGRVAGAVPQGQSGSTQQGSTQQGSTQQGSTQGAPTQGSPTQGSTQGAPTQGSPHQGTQGSPQGGACPATPSQIVCRYGEYGMEKSGERAGEMGGQKSGERVGETTGQQPSGQRVGEQGGQTTQGSGQQGGREQGQIALADVRIAGFLLVANKGEIDTSRVVLQKGASGDVAAFANRMIAEHSAAQKRQIALFESIGLCPGLLDEAKDLQKRGEEALAKLRPASGMDAERIYAQAQVEAHQLVLSRIEAALPEVCEQRTRDELTKAREVIRSHLEQARRLLEACSSGAKAQPQQPEQPQQASTLPTLP